MCTMDTTGQTVIGSDCLQSQINSNAMCKVKSTIYASKMQWSGGVKKPKNGNTQVQYWSKYTQLVSPTPPYILK